MVTTFQNKIVILVSNIWKLSRVGSSTGPLTHLWGCWFGSTLKLMTVLFMDSLPGLAHLRRSECVRTRWSSLDHIWRPWPTIMLLIISWSPILLTEVAGGSWHTLASFLGIIYFLLGFIIVSSWSFTGLPCIILWNNVLFTFCFVHYHCKIYEFTHFVWSVAPYIDYISIYTRFWIEMYCYWQWIYCELTLILIILGNKSAYFDIRTFWPYFITLALICSIPYFIKVKLNLWDKFVNVLIHFVVCASDKAHELISPHACIFPYSNLKFDNCILGK
jgi:hypothetical protein